MDLTDLGKLNPNLTVWKSRGKPVHSSKPALLHIHTGPTYWRRQYTQALLTGGFKKAGEFRSSRLPARGPTESVCNPGGQALPDHAYLGTQMPYPSRGLGAYHLES